MKAKHDNQDLKQYRIYSQNRSFSILEFESEKEYFIEPHWHNSIEIIYVVHGSVKILQELAFFELKENDIIYLASNIVHSVTFKPNTRIISLQISTIWLHEVIPSYLSNDIFLCSSTVASPSKRADYDNFIKHFLLLKDVFFLEDKNKEIGINGYVFLLLYLMTSQFQTKVNIIRNDQFKYQYRIKQISKFVNEHYHENIKLDQIALELEVSPQYLSKIFKKYYKISFKDYLSKIRTEHAIYELTTTNHTMLEISENCGFPSQHAFIYTFKHFYNMTPGQFKKTQIESL